MKISVSNLNFLGIDTPQLQKLPLDIGLEVFVEFGDDYFWKSWLELLQKGRTGGFSIHGPHQNLDLADPALEEDRMLASFRRAFAIGRDHGASHLVVHPNAPYRRPDSQRQVSKDASFRRLGLLAQLSAEYGVPLCLENMGYGDPDELLFSQEEYLSFFERYPQLCALIDLGKLNLAGWDLAALAGALGRRITAYHLHDNDGDADLHRSIGKGSFDWDRFWPLYHQATPEAALILEYIGVPMEVVLDDVRALRRRLG